MLLSDPRRHCQPPMPPIPADIVAAISNPPTPRQWPTDAEMGAEMRARARYLVDHGDIKSKSDIQARLKAYADWFAAMAAVITDDTAERWMRYEVMLAASANKYLRELAELAATTTADTAATAAAQSTTKEQPTNDI